LIVKSGKDKVPAECGGELKQLAGSETNVKEFVRTKMRKIIFVYTVFDVTLPLE
jgi:hypothetical protein